MLVTCTFVLNHSVGNLCYDSLVGEEEWIIRINDSLGHMISDTLDVFNFVSLII